MGMAGLAAILEIDIKKVIALSTLSQLGVIIMILGGGCPTLAYFHLLSHAYLKDLILETILVRGMGLIIMAAVLFSTFLTVAYSCRLRFLVGLNYIKAEVGFQVREGDKIMLTGIFILFPFAI